MKKSLLIIAAAALVFAGCAENDTFKKDINEIDGDNGGTIGFTSFTEKVTKGANDKAENSEALYSWTFFDHQESFQVWARKANQPEQEIFDGTVVTVTKNNSEYTYTYDPARFWDKLAPSYEFFAAAPASDNTDAWTFTHTNNTLAGIADGYFSTTSTLYGVNLKHVDNGGADTELENEFKNISVSSTNTAKDIDKLIAAPAHVAQNYYNKSVADAVNLNFIHILSKLNITISTALTQTTGGHDYDVDILAFEVKNVPNNGKFDEARTFTAHGKNIRWYDYGTTTTSILTGIDDNTNKKDVPLTTAPKLYIVESLMIPQEIEYERVALDGLAHDAVQADAIPFADYEAYEKARNNDATRLTQAQFNALFTGEGASRRFITDEEFSANPSGYTQVGTENIDLATFQARKADASATPAINIAAYSAPTKPYFTITYSIDGEIFTANYNLAAAFKNYDNNGHQSDGTTAIVETTFPFYEGWQNTLNIIINPTAIKFTADVAEWSDYKNVSYEIEKGNE